MKKLFSIMAAALMVLTVNAQEEGHWYLGLQGGAALTTGEAAIKDLVSPTAGINLGYQFNPTWGLQGTVSGWQGKGALVGPSALYNFNFAQADLDVTMDLINLFASEKKVRAINPYLLAGAGVNYAFNNGASDYMPARKDNLGNYWENSNISPVVKGGVGINIKLSPKVLFNIEANTNVLNDNFNSKVGGKFDYQHNVLVGLRFNLGGKAAPAPVVVPPAAPEPAPAPAPAPKEEAKPAPAPAPKYAGYEDHIFFVIDRATIRASEQVKIDEIVKILNANPETKILVTGYADKNTGTPDYNKALSEKRAKNVARALKDAGIAESRITVDWKGSDINPFPTPKENRVAVCIVE